MSTEVTHLAEFPGDVDQLLQINYKGRVKKYLGVMSAVGSLFSELGPGEYTYDGQVLRFAGDYTYRGGAIGTSGFKPAPQYVDPVNLDTNAARISVAGAVDNFIVAAGAGPAAFENFMDRQLEQMWDAFERAMVRMAHGSSLGTLCVIDTVNSATNIVVEDGYGYPGTAPTMFLEPGGVMWVAVLDASGAFASLGAAVIDTIQRNTPVAGQDTITFVAPGVAGMAAGDVLVFSTSDDPTDFWYETERGNAMLGLIDLLDPADALSSYLTASLSDHPRLQRIRAVSADWGEVEFMEFVTEIQSRSNAPVTPESHTFTMHPGVKTELAKTLIPFTQIEQKGRELEGGWTTVRLAGHDLLEDPYHIPDVVYGICYEDAFQVDLDGEPRIWDGDGSMFQRLIHFDGKEWYAKSYRNRFLDRRNRCGSLVGVSNPYAFRFTPTPAD